MKLIQSINTLSARFFILFFLVIFVGNAQILKVEIVGGSEVINASTITIDAGASLDFRITNIDGSSCKNNKRLDIDSVELSIVTGTFSISPSNRSKNLRQISCPGNGNKALDFTVTNTNATCSPAETDIVIESELGIFTFTLIVNSSPVISVLGGSPSADILNGSTTTTATNGTYFGIIEAGATVTRYFIITNTGSCDLDITAITLSPGWFFVPTTPAPYVILPDFATPDFLPANISPGSFVVLPITFVAPAGTGTQTSTISISNNDNTTFTFDVSANLFDFNIPGPGGITADFRLWLKSTRGVTRNGSNKVSNWTDIGTNGKPASQGVSANQPTYMDDATSNINFNPVIKFENDGSTISQYLENTDNGFYGQDIFIVMQPDDDVTTSTGMTIFSGSISDIIPGESYVDDTNDVTAVGLGNYTTNLTGERLWYNQGSSTTNPYYALPGNTSNTYSAPGIINVGNKTTTVSDGMRILYNSIDDNVTSAQSITTFENVGYIDTAPDPDVVFGTPYEIGKNRNATLGNLNGRIAEIFTFAERVPDAGRLKIESYLAIKFGITLGSFTEAQKDYENSFVSNHVVWDISANTGYNYHVAGIGRDDNSDLNQKQSKTVNQRNEVIIGLGGIYATNSVNPNEFNEDGDFLVWGSNDAAYTASGSNTITIASGITSDVTRILRQWKIVETKQPGSGDVENIFVSIPAAAFSSFALATDEEYALIVADNDAFANGDIIDVIPLKSVDGGVNLQTWYDFDGTKYFTFGKVSKLTENRALTIGATDYLVGEYALNLNINAFTISAWVKSASGGGIRTLMCKGEKLQIRLNASDQVEVMVDDSVTPRFTSTMALDDGKWHQISFVYKSGSVFFYIDGVLDKSEQNVEPPTPNFNRFALGALYIDKNNISNHFLGEIDEVYVWDQELTQDQVRYLMNQEIENFDDSGTNSVTGKIIPQLTTSNEIVSLPWSNLKAYYDFNSFYGSTVEGLTDDRNYIRLKYLDKDKEVTEGQTAPLPYVSAADGDWDTLGTWSNSADQIIPNSLSLDGTTIIDWNIVQLSHNIDSGDRDISLLGLIQTGGRLTIAYAVVTPKEEDNAGQGLTISHYLELDGVIDLVGESQLVQLEGSVLDADSGGYIERDQQGTANGFNYNYWSSSVGPIGGNSATRGTGVSSTNANYTIDGVVNDGTLSFSYDDLNFETSPYASDGSPPPPGFVKTISAYWLYKFYGEYDNYYAWSKIDETSDLLPGEGFTMKGTSGAVSITTKQNYVFEGLPNNGDITLPLDNSSGEVERLIGNPYPSAMSATEFILDNMSVADGGNNPSETVFNGALYFWDHFGEENSHYLADYVGGYATRNLTAGSIAISNDSRINNTSNAGNPAEGTKVPGEYIAVNQGFFVNTTLSGYNNDNGVPITSVDGGTIVFKNRQRVYVTEDGSTSLFFKSTKGKTAKTSNNKNNRDNKSIIRLMYDSPLGYHRQIVLGENSNASSGFDLGYDAFMIDVNKEDMYWAINNGKFVIQGVKSFDDAQSFPLGLIVKKAGLVSLRLDALENVESNKSVYIKDNITGEAFEINNSAFQIHLEPGSYNDRFELVFQSSDVLLNTPEVNNFSNGILMYYNSEASVLELVNKNSLHLANISIFNILGQNVKAVNLDSYKSESIPLNLSTGAYIVKLQTENGVLSRKVIID